MTLKRHLAALKRKQASRPHVAAKMLFGTATPTIHQSELGERFEREHEKFGGSMQDFWKFLQRERRGYDPETCGASKLMALVDEIREAQRPPEVTVFQGLDRGKGEATGVITQVDRVTKTITVNGADTTRVNITRIGPGESVTIETERETDDRWIAEVTELPGCLVYGESEEDARAKARELAQRIREEQTP